MLILGMESETTADHKSASSEKSILLQNKGFKP